MPVLYHGLGLPAPTRLILSGGVVPGRLNQCGQRAIQTLGSGYHVGPCRAWAARTNLHPYLKPQMFNFDILNYSYILRFINLTYAIQVIRHLLIYKRCFERIYCIVYLCFYIHV